MKSDTNCGHFAWAVVNEMEWICNLYSKRQKFDSLSPHHPFWTNLEQKGREAFVVVDNILQKVSRVYWLVQ
jgi:hypothetical protein